MCPRLKLVLVTRPWCRTHHCEFGETSDAVGIAIASHTAATDELLHGELRRYPHLPQAITLEFVVGNPPSASAAAVSPLMQKRRHAPREVDAQGP